MAEQVHRIVPAEESDLHDEPHVAGSRITVRFIHERVETVGLDPWEVADRHNLGLADVYHAHAYYHEHPEEMRRVERERERTIEAHCDRAISGPDDVARAFGWCG
jgi:uncharacterized protein (DUF433 family)